ncbi:Kinesin motor family protein [Perilla frutescens var. frutescens]|nr:Kinesin motor family protein [Perilla frutescens var. frutescens]
MIILGPELAGVLGRRAGNGEAFRPHELGEERRDAGNAVSRYSVGNTRRPQLLDEVTMSDHMDLLVEQVKMLAGEIAFGSSTLKLLVEQSANDPESSRAQIQNLECEIQEKRNQMRVLEQRIVESGEASDANASMVEMQQTIMKLMTQCSQKGFELEVFLLSTSFRLH